MNSANRPGIPASISDHELVFGGADNGDRMCPKCAGGPLKPHYHRGGEVCDIHKNQVRDSREHLHFICSRCGYERTTLCADQLAQV